MERISRGPRGDHRARRAAAAHRASRHRALERRESPGPAAQGAGRPVDAGGAIGGAAGRARRDFLFARHLRYFRSAVAGHHQRAARRDSFDGAHLCLRGGPARPEARDLASRPDGRPLRQTADTVGDRRRDPSRADAADGVRRRINLVLQPARADPRARLAGDFRLCRRHVPQARPRPGTGRKGWLGPRADLRLGLRAGGLHLRAGRLHRVRHVPGRARAAPRRHCRHAVPGRRAHPGKLRAAAARRTLP